jgi:(1->4)-alpha-D-glucan 1-alpha-D-glucosylmutase
MQARVAALPHGLTTTATHDTKRGEDARARILSLSEMAEDWAEAVQEWQKLNSNFAKSTDPVRAPSPAHEYMLYQALIGAWPLGKSDKSFLERMQAYAVKAAREGKEQTSWLAPQEDYENGLRNFLEKVLSSDHSADFLQSFDVFARRTALMGALNSLTQVALKITMPGVPDFYQGTELWDLSLVDPDNRRPVDFAARAAALTDIAENPDWHRLAQDWPSGRIKFALTRHLLALRQRFEKLFTNGSYRPLQVVGPGRDEIIAFARSSGREGVVVVAGRHFGRSTNKGRVWPSTDAWAGTAVKADGFSSLRPLIGAGPRVDGSELPVPELFGALPIAILGAEFADTTKRRAQTAPLVAVSRVLPLSAAEP